MLQIPAGGGSEVDKWKMLVQVQETALRKEAMQRDELQRQMDSLAVLYSDHDNNAKSVNPITAQILELRA